MTQEEYKAYLLSDEWQRKREKRIEIDDGHCVFCGRKTDNPIIHHLTYKHIGDEDVWRDICTVCKDCHSLIHAGMCRVTSPSGRRGWRDELPYIVRANLITRGLM